MSFYVSTVCCFGCRLNCGCSTALAQLFYFLSILNFQLPRTNTLVVNKVSYYLDIHVEHLHSDILTNEPRGMAVPADNCSSISASACWKRPRLGVAGTGSGPSKKHREPRTSWVSSTPVALIETNQNNGIKAYLLALRTTMRGSLIHNSESSLTSPLFCDRRGGERESWASGRQQDLYQPQQQTFNKQMSSTLELTECYDADLSVSETLYAR